MLSSPDEDIKQLQSEQVLNAAVGTLASLETTLHQNLLSQQGTVANTRTQYNDAIRQAIVYDSLAVKKLHPMANDVAAAHDKVTEFKQRMWISSRSGCEDMQRLGAAADRSPESADREPPRDSQRAEAPRRFDACALARSGSSADPRQPAAFELGQYINAGTVTRARRAARQAQGRAAHP